MARKKLASLLETPAEETTTEAAAPEKPTTEQPPATTSGADAVEKPAAASVLFDELVRKECRFRDDQLEDLSKYARRLQRMRTAPGARITDNTLIRVAVDLLLTRADELKGSNEEEFRASLGLTD